MQKPESMKKFDLFFWGSIALSVIGLVFSWATMQEVMAAELAEAEGVMGEGMMQGVLVVSFVIGIGINIAIWFLISVLRIEFVKWIFIALVVWGLISLPEGVALVGGFGLMHVPGLLATVLSLLAIWMLFRPDAKEWFAAKKSGE